MKKINIRRQFWLPPFSGYHLFLAASLTISGLPAWAQDTEVLEEVIVRGIRGSLERSLDIKRNSDKIVDVISAEDIGKFPDANLAEALQRITGVQITRSRGEGRNVSIRGLPSDFTQTMFNGRMLASGVERPETDTVPRSFDFTVLSSDFVSVLEVYKAPSADQTEGGLAGTVNIRTPRPFETGQRKFSVSINGTHEDNTDVNGSQSSFLYSNVFADDRFGLTLGASYSERKLETNVGFTGYNFANESENRDYNGDGTIDPSLRVLYPGNSILQVIPEERERLNLLGTVEFQINDATDLYVEAFYTELDTQTERLANFHRFVNIAANGVIDSSRTSATTLSIQDGDSVFRDVQFAEVLAATAVDQRNGSRSADQFSESNAIATGINYDSDRWRVFGEISYSKSEQVRSYLNIAAAAFGGLGGTGGMQIDNTARRDLPSITYFNGYDTARLDPDNFRLFSLNGEFNRQSKDEAIEALLDLELKFNSQRFTSLELGARVSAREFFLDNGRLVVGGDDLNALLGGLLQPSVAIPGALNLAPLMQRVEVGDGYSAFSGSVPSRYLSSNTRALLQMFSDDELAAAGNVLNPQNNVFDIEEDTQAAFAKLNFEIRNGDITGDVGVRVVHTDQLSRGVGSDLGNIVVEPEAGDFTTLPPAGDIVVERDYWDVLPSLNVRWDIDDARVLRFALNRTMSRPTLNLLTPTTSVDAAAFSVSARNPNLDPFRSNNIDLSYEWYFDDGALLSATAFFKNLDSLVTRVSNQQNVSIIIQSADGTQVPAERLFTFNTFDNASGVRLFGVEVLYQQNFDMLPGLLAYTGIAANYTFIDNSDPELLTGASENNYNFTGYYEDDKLSARLTYTFRDSFISGALGPDSLGTEQQSYGTLDGSVSYYVNENTSLYVEASNLTDEPVVELTRIGTLPKFYEENGRRYLVGVRFNF